MICGDWQNCGSPGCEWTMGDYADDGDGPAPPFGRDPDDLTALLAYLGGCSRGEWEHLARVAASCLDWGDWEGVPTDRGGWIDLPADDRDRQWHATALDFALRYRSGDRTLTEGMLHFAAYDLCCELGYDRGWCPHAPWDKHAADEVGSPTPFATEPELLIRISAYEDETRSLASRLLGGHACDDRLCDEAR